MSTSAVCKEVATRVQFFVTAANTFVLCYLATVTDVDFRPLADFGSQILNCSRQKSFYPETLDAEIVTGPSLGCFVTSSGAASVCVILDLP